MSNKVTITADSPCDMPKDLQEKYHVRIIPLHIIFGDESYEDGVNIDTVGLFNRCEAEDCVPGTSAISVAEYKEFFDPIVADGSDIVHLSLSGAISSTCRNACMAAGESGHIFVVDTLNLHSGMTALIIKACELRDKGFSAKEISDRLALLRSSVKTCFIVDKMDFLRKGGRCSAIAAFGANVLSIKPSLKMNPDGSIGLDRKYRGKSSSCRQDFLRDFLNEPGEVDTDRFFLTCTDGISDEELEAMRKEIRKKYKFREIITAKAGCTIASHCGPKTFGLTMMKR